jgi:hypothetical protein
VITGCSEGGGLGCNPSVLPGPDNGGVTFADNCGGGVVTSSTFLNDTVGCVGTLIYQYIVTDTCSNRDTCYQTFSYAVDTTPPVITECPPGGNLGCNPTVLPSPDNLDVQYTDNCGGVIVTSSTFLSDTVGCVGTLVYRYIATDTCSNRDTCFQTFTYAVDNTPPVITICPVGGNLGCNPVLPGPNNPGVEYTDNCGGVLVTSSITQNDTVDCAGILVYRYIATDTCTNSDTCFQTYTYTVDNEPPSMVCPADDTISCNESSNPLNTGMPTGLIDNCDVILGATSSDGPSQGDDCETTFVRTWSVQDDCGNVFTCTQRITITDDIDPVCPTAPNDTLVMCVGQVPPGAPLTATDECQGLLIASPVDSDNGGAGCSANPLIITRTWTFDDGCGNTCTVDQMITVADTVRPLISCPAPLGFQCIAEVPAPDTASVTATDNCGEVDVTFVSELSDGTCPMIIIRTYSATDACGNVALCTQTIIVDDTVPPSITCPRDTMFEWPVGFNMQPVPPNVPQDPSIPPQVTGFPIVNDNCGIDSLVFIDQLFGPFPQNCPNLWYVERRWFVFDSCGNSNFCLQVITFTDNTPPQITCPNDATFECGDVIPAPSITTIIATDNCGTPIVTFVGETFTQVDNCPVVAIIVRTYKATDNCMNMTTCTQTIVIEDTTPPVIDCPD